MVSVRGRLSRNASMYRLFWVGFDGRRKRKQARRPAARVLTPAKWRALELQRPTEEAERQRIAAMTPEQYARHIGLPEDQVARVRRIAELRGPSPGGPAAAQAQLRGLKGETGGQGHG